MDNISPPSPSPEFNQMINEVFYCGISNVITVFGIFGNLILILILIHSTALPHKTLFHSYLKVFPVFSLFSFKCDIISRSRSHLLDFLILFQAIAVADLCYLIYITIFNFCVCMGVTDYPVEVSSRFACEKLFFFVY